jgi:hypothetical protein
MNMRHEALLWSIAITAAIALGLIVVWGAIALAFSRPNFAPLYFAAAPYRQDDYSAEDMDAVRLNPLDPSLEQEVALGYQARVNPMPDVNYNPAIAPPAPADIPPLALTNPPPPANVPITPKPANPNKPDKKPPNPNKPDKTVKPHKP